MAEEFSVEAILLRLQTKVEHQGQTLQVQVSQEAQQTITTAQDLTDYLNALYPPLPTFVTGLTGQTI